MEIGGILRLVKGQANPNGDALTPHIPISPRPLWILPGLVLLVEETMNLCFVWENTSYISL